LLISNLGVGIGRVWRIYIFWTTIKFWKHFWTTLRLG